MANGSQEAVGSGGGLQGRRRGKQQSCSLHVDPEKQEEIKVPNILSSLMMHQVQLHA
jgi:hypothetical protein